MKKKNRTLKRTLKSKRCLYCNNIFTQNYNCSEKEWNQKRRYCSCDCSNKALIGSKHSEETKRKMVKTRLNNGVKRVGYNYWKKKS